MSADTERTAGFSLRRWSRRKLEVARATSSAPPSPSIVAPADALPLPAAAAASAATAEGDAAHPAAAALPPVETLTFDSDFTAFLQPKVEEALKRTALRKLFRDPRFNVMDGLDVYVEDYSIPDPISPELVRELMQARYIFDPPPTRVTAEGFVEDVPPEERDAEAADIGAGVPVAIASADDASPAPRPSPEAGADDLASEAGVQTASASAAEIGVPVLADSDARPDR